MNNFENIFSASACGGIIAFVAIVLLFLAYVAYRRYGQYFAPAVIAPASWGAVLLIYGLLDHGMQDISMRGLMVVVLWNLSLLAGTWLFSEFAIYNHGSSKIPKMNFNSTLRTVYFWIAVLGSIPLLYIAYKQGTTMGADFFFNLRMANTGLEESEYGYGIWQYAFVFAFVSFLIELFSYQKGDSKKRIYILLIVNILQSLITMAKSNFFFLFLSLFFSVMFRRKIQTRYLIIGFSILVLLMSSLQLMRSSSQDHVLSDMFYVYTLGGIPALDEVITADMRSEQWGQSTMRFFRTVSSVFGAVPVQNNFVNDITEKGYLFVPLPTNVLTVIGPFWLDFGYCGVGLFGFIIGGLSGFLYKQASKKQLWAVIAYSYIACTLVLQFFGEYIFTNLSYTIQILLLTLLAYKFNYIVKWRR